MTLPFLQVSSPTKAPTNKRTDGPVSHSLTQVRTQIISNVRRKRKDMNSNTKFEDSRVPAPVTTNCYGGFLYKVGADSRGQQTNSSNLGGYVCEDHEYGNL